MVYDHKNEIYTIQFTNVLILILLDYTNTPECIAYRRGLNPCFTGLWSMIGKRIYEGTDEEKVLILVLLDYGL